MLDPRVLDDVVRRIVAVARPERIILFGSAARGQMAPHGDVDLLVVKQERIDEIWPAGSTRTCTASARPSTWSWSLPRTSIATGTITRS